MPPFDLARVPAHHSRNHMDLQEARARCLLRSLTSEPLWFPKCETRRDESRAGHNS